MATPFENTLSVLRTSSRRSAWWLAGIGVAAMLAWSYIAFTVPVPVSVSSVEGKVVPASEPLDVYSTSEESIAALPVKLGDAVTVGDVLVAFDPVPLRLELEAKKQRAAKLVQELASVEQEIASARASLANELESYDRAYERLQARLGETRAQLEHARKAEALYAELRSERRIDALKYSEARAEREQKQMALRAQRAELEELQANRRLAASQLETTVAQLNRQKAALKGDIAELEPQMQSLRNRLAELTVRAPFAGRIGDIARVAKGQTVAVGDWLMTLVPLQQFEFQASFLAEEAAGRVALGQPASIRFHALPWTEYGALRARVIRVGSQERNGTVRVDLELAEHATLSGRLAHGLTGQVVVRIEEATLARRLLRLLGTPDDRPRTVTAS